MELAVPCKDIVPVSLKSIRITIIPDHYSAIGGNAPTTVDILPHNNALEVLKVIYCRMTRPLIPMAEECFITKIPRELLLVIIKHARRGNRRDLDTLNALTLTCRSLMMFMRVHREAIIEHYIVNIVVNYTHVTQFCGRKHSIVDQPSQRSISGDTLRWHRFGALHRVNGPAFVYNNQVGGNEYHAWYRNGKVHRDGGEPAIITLEWKRWMRNGEYYRDNDLPTEEYASGTKVWYQGKSRRMHRDGDKPARIRADGTQEWYQHGKRHRIGGRPAITYTDGRPPAYWVRGKRIQYHG